MELLLTTNVGPAEVDARLRLVTTRTGATGARDTRLRVGELTIEEETYTARLRHRPLRSPRDTRSPLPERAEPAPRP